MNHRRFSRAIRLATLLAAGIADRPGVGAAEGSPAAGEASVSSAEAHLQPGTVLDPAALDPAWQALLTRLGRDRAIYSTFVEHRWFAVRKQPVVLRGELRRSPEHGLSLRYLEPEEQLMIIDESGIVLRNAAGRSRRIKPDARAPQIDALLLPVLRFDLEALHTRFEIRGARRGGRWRLDFTPRAPEQARALGRLTVHGEDEAVRGLEFSRGPKQRVDVKLESTREGIVFTDDEVRRFFR